MPLIVSEKKQFVFLDRSANRAAELLQSHLCLGSRRYVVVVARIEGGVPTVGVSRAVQGVGTRFDSDVDDRARLPAVFRARIFFRLEFINGVHRQDRPGIARVQGRIHDALAIPGSTGKDAIH